MAFSPEKLVSLQDMLDGHPVYAGIADLQDLRLFMQHHAYSVWDFMSLVKFLQQEVAPVGWPWKPAEDPSVVRFINELVLEEECDENPFVENGFSSHFELYLGAMEEIGADTSQIRAFVANVASQGYEKALADPENPPASVAFTRHTFEVLASGKPHLAAAALALGREKIIPMMFRRFLAEMKVSEEDAPRFHFYLNRHVHLDEDFHWPLSLRLLNALCDSEEKEREAEEAARQAIEARLAFWDGVMEKLK